ncbi:class I SAM-dependent methyltransferase [Salinispira pacifica]
MSASDITRLISMDRRPRLFARGTGDFWTEPYIAEHVLYAHLDPESDDASRPHAHIAQSAAWIARTVRSAVEPGLPPGRRLRLIDLGCGPGLYAAHFARNGFDVLGIDYSPVSIKYAASYAEKHGLSASFACTDMRNLSEKSAFHAATMIYGGFCVLSNRDRQSMLRRIRRALVDGGLLILDVFNRAYVKRTAVEARWYTAMRRGFWDAGPHLVLERSFEYLDSQVGLNRYLIATTSGELREYNVWRHWYDEESIRMLLEGAGFRVEGVYGDLTGSPVGDPAGAGEWLGVVARREG